MIKVSVIYPRDKGTWFNADYYKNSHLPMVKDCLGDACIQILQQTACNESQPFYAVGELTFASLEIMQAAFAPHAKTFHADLANYTDVQPLRQLSIIEAI